MSTSYANFLAICALICAVMTATGFLTKNGEAVTIAGLVMLGTVAAAWVAGRNWETN